jgi:cation:H+ antiporter
MAKPITRMGNAPPSTAPVRERGWWLIGLMAALTLPGMALRLSGMHVAPLVVALVAGVALVGAAFVLAWAAEAAQTVIAGGLAIALLALITVLPEYAVDVIFAWNAAHNPDQAHYAVANMTGANRLLIGIGWSGIVLLAAFIAWRRGAPRNQRNGVALPAHSVVEVVLLLAATAYSLVLPWRGSITLFDTVVLFAIFVFYLWFLSRASEREEASNLVGPARAIAALPKGQLGPALVGLFVLAAAAIALVAEPFAEGLVQVGHQLKIDDFILVQVVAPIASEAPEFVVVALFAFVGRGETSLQALISSKVNQWTLLVGSIPLVYSISTGHVTGFALDGRQTEELLLTAAQGLLAVILVLDRKLGVRESIGLLALYLLQFVFPSHDARIIFAWVYFGLAALAVVFSVEIRGGLFSAPRRFAKQLRVALRSDGGA